MQTQTFLLPLASEERPITLAIPHNARPEKLCVFLDGEHYLERMDALAVLDRLQQQAIELNYAYVFVSHLDEAHRHLDFTCNAAYADGIADILYDRVKQTLPSLTSGGHAICGLSLSGLAAAFIRIRHPHRFTSALCQSGSFWWNKEWLTHQAKNSHNGRYRISVGTRETQSGLTHAPSGLQQEVSQLDATHRFVEALRQGGNEVCYEQFDDGHNIEPWRAELAPALEWLLR